MISFTKKKNKGLVTDTEELSKILSNLPSLIIVKKTNVMTINFILDKINKYGLNSLTIEEKVFLENQSK